jgi:threonine dehydratase
VLPYSILTSSRAHLRVLQQCGELRRPRCRQRSRRPSAKEVIQTTGGLLDLCLALRPDRALTLVHPFDDLAIMGGQGAVGLELLDQVPRVDMIVVPIGGGGLISGIAAAVKLRHPSVRVVGVEPEGADVMSRSLMQGVPVHMENADTVADGFASPFAGEHAFRHVQRFVDEVVR